jgi:hypothetical protein
MEEVGVEEVPVFAHHDSIKTPGKIGDGLIIRRVPRIHIEGMRRLVPEFA